MWSATGGEIKDSIEPRAMAHHVGSFHVGGEVLVWRGIGGDRRRQLLREARLQATKRSKAGERQKRICEFDMAVFWFQLEWSCIVAGMQNLLRTIEFLGLSLWLGSDVFLSFVVAPGAFRFWRAGTQAGAMVGYALGRMHYAGIFLGLLFLVARLLRTREFASFATAAALCVVLMMVLTVASQFIGEQPDGTVEEGNGVGAEHARE